MLAEICAQGDVQQNDLQNDPILFYASECGIELKEGTFTLQLGEGKDRKTYFYNASKQTLSRQDRFGYAHFNEKNISERDTEKLRLFHQLKKLYFRKAELPYTNALQNGDFNINNFNRGELDSKIKSLEEKSQSINNVIEIFEAQDNNYGSSFGKQMDRCATLLNNLILIKRRATESEFTEQINVILENSIPQSTDNKKQEFLQHLLGILQNIEHTNVGKYIQEFSDLRKQNSDEFFDDFIRNIEHACLVLQKLQIEKELDKTKIIDVQIREKKRELKSLRENVRKECQLSEDDEKRFGRLLKAQGNKTNHLCKTGLLRTKEKSTDSAFIKKLRHCPFNIRKEKQDVATLLIAIDKEFGRAEKKKIDFIKENQKLILINENSLPLLREESDLVQIIQKKLKTSLDSEKEKIADGRNSEKTADSDINNKEREIGSLVEKLKREYDKLRSYLDAVEKLKDEITELQCQKEAVRPEEIKNFEETVFQEAGGRKSVGPNQVYHNHDDCTQLVAKHGANYCLYKEATDKTVKFCINQTNARMSSLDDSALFEYLWNHGRYYHSANTAENKRGDGKHANALRSAGNIVFREYVAVNERIMQRENALQNRIDEKERQREKKEKERDDLCGEIVNQENILNNIKINLLESEKKKRNISAQIRSKEKIEECMNMFKEKAEDLKSIVNERVDNVKEDLIVLEEDMATLNKDVYEILSDFIGDSDFVERLACSEARLTCGQIIKFLNVLSQSQSLEMAKKGVKAKKKEIEKHLRNYHKIKDKCKADLKKTENVIMEKEKIYKKYVTEQQKMVFKRSRLEKRTSIGLANSIIAHRKEIESLDKQRQVEIKKLVRERTKITKRKVFKEICTEMKGTTCLGDAETPENLGETGQLFKKRKVKKCQNVFVKRRMQPCEYFDSVEKITDKLLTNENEGFKSIFEEIGNSYTHCKEHHKQDLKDGFDVVRNAIREFQKQKSEVETDYQKQIDLHVEKMLTFATILQKKKKLDGTLIIKKEFARQDELQNKEIAKAHLQAGADIIFFDENHIYASPNSELEEFTLEEFFNKLIPSPSRTDALYQELNGLLQSSKSVQVTNVLMQKNSPRKTFYGFLVECFGKTFCKKTNDIVMSLNEHVKLVVTKSELKFKIEKTKREIEQLKRQEATLDALLAKVQELQRRRPNQISQNKNDLDAFLIMQEVCTSLLKKIKDENKEMNSGIANCTRKITEQKQKCKAVVPSADFWQQLKTLVLNDRIRIGLDETGSHHRNCDVNSCSYKSTVEELINYYCQGTVPRQHSTVIEQFLSRRDHFRKFHYLALKEVLSFIDAEIVKNKFSIISKIREEIAELEWTRSFNEAQIQANEKIIIFHLEKMLTDIRKFIKFREESLFLHEASAKDLDPLEKELEEYKEESFASSFKEQMTMLLSCVDILHSRLNINDFDVKNKESLRRTAYDVFKDYFDNLSKKNVTADVMEKLNEVLTANSIDETPLKKLTKEKSGKMGAVKWILNLISSYYKSDRFYDDRLDPAKVFRQKHLIEAQQQGRHALAQVEVLEAELSILNARKIELKLEDNLPLREKLENLDICIRVIADAKEIASLKTIIVESSDCWNNKDDYYSFNLVGRRVCVRLLGDDHIKKCAEINEINRVRSLIFKHEENLLEKKVCLEQITRELDEERQKRHKSNFLEVQRALFVKGVVLCGYDSFENGEPLDEIDSIISAITAALIGDSPLYQMNSLNELSGTIEDWTRNIRAKFDESNLINGVASLKKLIEQNGIEFIMETLNEEFSSDNLKIKQVNTSTKKFFSENIDEMGNGKCINLIDLDGKTFFLLQRDNDTDLNVKMTHVVSALRMEEDLFANLALKRIETHLRINLQESNNLQDNYKLELSNLSKIKWLKDFNSIFANILEKPDADNCWSNILFLYLLHLENLESAKNETDSVDKIERCGMIKDLYKNALKKIFREENQRRKNKQGLIEKDKSREELFLNEVVKDKEQELDELSQEIICVEEDIEKVSDKSNSLLLEKEKVRNVFNEKKEQLSTAIKNIEEKIKAAQEKIREINKELLENERSLTERQEEIHRLEIEIEEIENEIKTKKAMKKQLERELRELAEQEKELNAELERVNAPKERKEKELVEKSNEIEVTESFMKLLQNLWLVVSTNEFYQNKDTILSSVYARDALISFLSALNQEMAVIDSEGKTLWAKLTKEVNYEKLERFVAEGKEIGGESQQDSLGRLKAVLRAALHIDSDLVQEFSNGKLLNKFKIVAANVSSKEIQRKIRGCMEKEISCSENGGGLQFVNGILQSEDYGVTGIQKLPPILKNLIAKKIELKFKSEAVESNKNGKFKDAAAIINSLKIRYDEVMRLHIDEIEVIASGTFFLNESMIYPGIDITIGAVNMECIGDNLLIDTSGADGDNFLCEASGGVSKRRHKSQPSGDKGFDGFDGNHGGNAGNIVVKVEKLIKNLEGLKSVKANGGNGAEGQLGGDGDEGMKGADGKNGKANDTTWFGGGQTTIGLGSPGQPGGRGGACGNSGRPGLAGAAGVINVIQNGIELSLGERKPGRDAKNVLERKRPRGGEGGEPGLYGMDEVRDKKSFFKKTQTMYTVVDRKDLIEKNPQFKEAVKDNGTVEKKDSWWKLAASYVGGGVIGVALYKFRNKRIGYKEAEESAQYRNRDSDINNRRGKRNETEARLRSDETTAQEEKREAVNSDTLNSKLSEKTSADKELSGEKELLEQISDFVLEREQLEFEIDNYAQDAANITSQIQNVALARENKVSELEKIQEELASLRRRETNLNAARVASINQVLRTLEKSQNLRDQKEMTELELNESMDAIKNYQNLQKELHDNRNDHFRIIDDYIEAVRGDLERLRLYLKMLKSDYTKKTMHIKDLKKRCKELKSERVNEIEIEVELEEEVEQEVETELEQEMVNEIELNHKRKISSDFQKVPNELECYPPTEKEYDFNNIPNDTAELKMALNILFYNYRLNISDEKQVEKFLEKVRKKYKDFGEVKILLKCFQTQMRNIKLKKSLDKLSCFERKILLDYLSKINRRLQIDPLVKLNENKSVTDFAIKLLTDRIECSGLNIVKNIRSRLAGNHLLANDNLKEEIELLIMLFENRKLFHLGPCYKYLNEEDSTQWKKLVEKYNTEANLEDLADLTNQIGRITLRNASEKKQEKFPKFVETFYTMVSTTLSENFRFQTTLSLDSGDAAFNSLKQIKNIIHSVDSIKKENKEVVAKILKICSVFYETVDQLGIEGKSSNTLKTITVKLISYVDSSFENEKADLKIVEDIINEYLKLMKGKCLNPSL